jgi:uncharacterized protein
MADELKRTVVWKNLLLDGADYCSLWHTAEGWMLKGTVVGAIAVGAVPAGATKDQQLNSQPMLMNYEIHCDENWRTHRVQLERTIGSDVKTLSLTVESRGTWRNSGGEELAALRGCDDVDLAVTPATNTIAIRRLNLQIGSSESIIAAWVKFPDLTVQPLSQRYTRVSSNSYRYATNTGFSAEIVVDDLGLVTRYPGAWTRLATA